MKTALQSGLIFLQFMHRDIIAHKNQLLDSIINYAIIYPIIFGIDIAYLQVNIYFKTIDVQRNTFFFAGNIVLTMMVFTYMKNIELLFDFENKRFIDYQIILLNPLLILLEKILFTGLYSFCLMLPLYPMTAWLFGSYLDISHASWPKVLIILLLGSVCLSAYHILISCLLKNSMSTRSLWPRVSRPMIFLGGFAIPWYVMYQYSPILAYGICLNPCIYITEGVKGAITGSTLFIPFYICVIMLLLFITAMTSWALVAFRRRTDCL